MQNFIMNAEILISAEDILNKMVNQCGVDELVEFVTALCIRNEALYEKLFFALLRRRPQLAGQLTPKAGDEGCGDEMNPHVPSLYLMGFGNQKIPCIKAVRDRLCFGLREAKELVEKAHIVPIKLGTGTSDEMWELRERLVRDFGVPSIDLMIR